MSEDEIKEIRAQIATGCLDSMMQKIIHYASNVSTDDDVLCHIFKSEHFGKEIKEMAKSTFNRKHEKSKDF